MYVSDLNQTSKFYHDLLGLKVIGRVDGRHIFFKAGTSVLLCFIAEATSQDDHLPPHYGSGKLHMAFEVEMENYQSIKEQLISKGVDVIYEETWRSDVHSFYFHDPDGHVLEIVPKGMWDIGG